jgi:hypothetical protein
MKTIFVGVHNKTGMTPLDSESKSGKLIDKVIEKVVHEIPHNWQKTNLYDSYCLPDKLEKHTYAFDWTFRVRVEDNDIIVLLGNEVQKNFINRWKSKVVMIPHPGRIWGKEKQNKYVENAVFKIIKSSKDD